MRRRARILLGALALLGAAGALHAPLLRALAPSRTCPADKPTLDGLEKTRARALPSLRGQAPAPSHAALGFVIGTTTAAQADGPGCAWDVPDALLRCPDADGSLVARFDHAGVLVGLDRQDTARSPDAALRLFEERVRGYESQYGTPHGRGGEASVSFLSAPLRQASVRYRFDDLALDVTATHLGQGVVLREQIREVPPARSGQTGG